MRICVSFKFFKVLISYWSKLTNAVRSAKPVSTLPQPTDVFVQPILRYSTHVFERCDSLRRPLGLAYERSFKLLHRKPKYCTIDRDGANANASIVCF
ncbi:unnamed protein product [Schistosoma margrebowiei]|uniref:Uncharacterized protein n=1 Tax=Schistosoma margrebowiei TaxID=48269 RepID=A0A183N975_9TREM|nr:unnamed protein product [Schistosoma margrebowiei]